MRYICEVIMAMIITRILTRENNNGDNGSNSNNDDLSTK